MGSDLPACFECKRLLRHLQTRLACTQYRKGIPHEIVMGKRCPFFEPEPGASVRKQRKEGR